MKPTQMEILVFTDTKFSSKELSDKNYRDHKNNFPRYKLLEEASWNGLFEEILPELFEKDRNRKKLILWQVLLGEHFLDLEYSEQPQPIDNFFSVNPYLFMGMQILS